MKNTIIFLITLTAIQVFADNGGGSSTGPSLCSYGEYTCVDKEPIPSVVACPFKERTFVSLSVSDKSHDQLFSSNQVSSGQVGAGVEFSGTGIDLKIQTDVPSSPKGWPSELTVPSFGLAKVKLHCRKSHRFDR